MPFSASNRISLTEFSTKESRENCNRQKRAFPKKKERVPQRKEKISTQNSNLIKSGTYPGGIRNKKLGCSLPERQRPGFGGGTRNRRQRRDGGFPISWRADASHKVTNPRGRGAPAAPLPLLGRYGCRLRR